MLVVDIPPPSSPYLIRCSYPSPHPLSLIRTFYDAILFFVFVVAALPPLPLRPSSCGGCGRKKKTLFFFAYSRPALGGLSPLSLLLSFLFLRRADRRHCRSRLFYSRRRSSPLPTLPSLLSSLRAARPLRSRPLSASFGGPRVLRPTRVLTNTPLSPRSPALCSCCTLSVLSPASVATTHLLLWLGGVLVGCPPP